MPKQRSRHCENCRQKGFWETLKRLYERGLKGQFVPVGWYCPRCYFSTFDEDEQQTEREKRAEAHLSF